MADAPSIDLIKTAPRHYSDLMNLSRFQLRLIAEELGRLNTTQKSQEWVNKRLRDQAVTLAGWLKEHDAKKGSYT
jgi:hypothetical protein